MRIEPVEIYSDATNAAVMRHPGRKFPGYLLQGDSLHVMCLRADEACLNARPVLDSESYQELNDLRNSLWAALNHYKTVLAEHGLPLPFNEIP
jgi:hypothetical protein